MKTTGDFTGSESEMRMKVFRTLEDSEQETAIALGFFDGVHVAHQKVINTAVMYKVKKGYIPTVFTFSVDKFAPKKKQTKMLFSEDIKIELIRRQGVEQLYIPPFREIVCMGPEQFFYEVLLKKLKVKEIACGFDYTFGKDGKGNVDLLTRLCEENNLILDIVNPRKIQDVLVGSTIIRILLEQGDVEKANALLGHTYFIRGKVVHGNHIGKTIGFPTANVELAETQVVPCHGVYESFVTIGDRTFHGITNIGVKPTIAGERRPLMETHVVGLEEEIYGQEIQVALVHMIRREQKFDNIEQLKNAIAADLNSLKE